jgi:hypothetical protein
MDGDAPFLETRSRTVRLSRFTIARSSSVAKATSCRNAAFAVVEAACMSGVAPRASVACMLALAFSKRHTTSSASG